MLFRYEAQSAPVLANDVGLSQVVDRLCALDDPHWHPPLRLQPAVAEESRSAVNQRPAMGTINWSLGENLTQECQQSGFDIVGRRPPNLALVCGQLWQCLQRFLAATSTLLFEELRGAIWCNSQERVWWLPSFRPRNFDASPRDSPTPLAGAFLGVDPNMMVQWAGIK